VIEIKKPDGTIGTVRFAYLASNAPEPFKSEWNGGQGIHEHDKFVVTDFNLPTADFPVYFRTKGFKFRFRQRVVW